MRFFTRLFSSRCSKKTYCVIFFFFFIKQNKKESWSNERIKIIGNLYQPFLLFDYWAAEIAAVEIGGCVDLECLCARKQHQWNQWHDLLSNRNVTMLNLYKWQWKERERKKELILIDKNVCSATGPYIHQIEWTSREIERERQGNNV